MKKVFSKEAFIKDNIHVLGQISEIDNHALAWIHVCEGKTAGEMLKMGYLTLEEWMIEVDDK